MLNVKTVIAVLLMVSPFGIAACGDDDGDEGGTTTGRKEAGTTAGGDETGTTAGGDETETSTQGSGEPILIKTHLAPLDADRPSSGKVRSGSTIGDSAFCTGGNFLDSAVQASSRSVTRSFRCPGGTLTITFTSTPPSVKQRSDWKVENGVGRFEGLSGGGRMRGKLYESGRGGGRETFTGTVTR
jgi:hypothetical protein